MKIYTRNLGLAAYISMKIKIDTNKVDIQDREFVFESKKSVQEWMLEYAKDECFEHDERVMGLRRRLSKQ